MCSSGSFGANGKNYEILYQDLYYISLYIFIVLRKDFRCLSPSVGTTCIMRQEHILMITQFSEKFLCVIFLERNLKYIKCDINLGLLHLSDYRLRPVRI